MGDEGDDDDASLGCSERTNEIEPEQGKTKCSLWFGAVDREQRRTKSMHTKSIPSGIEAKTGKRAQKKNRTKQSKYIHLVVVALTRQECPSVLEASRVWVPVWVRMRERIVK